MRIISMILIYLLILTNRANTSLPTNMQSSGQPRLVIGIVVENMRPDYIQRYWDKFGTDGFKKLWSEGTVCTNVHLNQHIQSYAAGTATLFTGVTPSIHGIVDKTWYDRMKSRITECTEDDYYFTTGSDTDWGNASPKKLLASTITDNLKVFTRGKSLVFSAAMNRETAVFAAGHAADGAYWLDPESGNMISSSFYISTFPEWVMDFNSENYPEMYGARNWVTLYPESEYTESVEDNYPLEKGYFDEFKTFPHTLGKYTRTVENLTPLKTTPYGNLVMKDFAIKLLDNEPVGQDDTTDFFTVAFSSMDYANGFFGPVSLEMQDTYLYLDQYIGEIISYAEKKFGKENILFFLTANTSASYPVDYLKEEFHFPVDHFSPESAVALLTSYLNISFGEEQWIEHYNSTQIYLDHDLIKKNKLDLSEIQNETSQFINQFEGVQLSLPAFQLEQGGSSNGLLATLYRSYFKNRSGDILFLLKEGWQPAYKFQKVNYTDQTHIPLVFYGSSLSARTIKSKYSAIDLVPTLCDILRIPYPDKLLGTPVNRDN
jgi:predicted AlkP superfamily pyrophosphatase or phosphodiesterase